MDKENDIDALQEEFQTVRDELKEILMDIRVHLMEVQSPIPNELNKQPAKEELNSQRG